MNRKPRLHPLPGQGRVHNLVDQGSHESCPCCGAVWRKGRPWSRTVMTVAEFAELKGITRPAVYSKIRRGIVAAYLGEDGTWQIPIVQPAR